MKKRKKSSNKGKMIVLIVLSFIVILAIGGYFYFVYTISAVDKDNKTDIYIKVKQGETMSSLADELKKKDLIHQPLIFTYYAKYLQQTELKEGQYIVNKTMNAKNIIDKFVNGEQAKAPALTIPEGLNIPQTAEKISAYTNLKDADVMAQLNDKVFVKKMIEKYPNLITDNVLQEGIKYPLEGYLFPATYTFPVGDKPTVQQIAEEMIQKTDKVITPHLEEIKKTNLSVNQFLAFTSLLEKEATAHTDRSKIASVFYNRLEAKMPIQSDVTVLYALNKTGTTFVSYKDIKVDSPYNTYLIDHLPIGPISNSSELSINAALNPAKTDYYYFLADTETGDVYYAKTLKEHNRLAAKHVK
ncbi:endolytic transglycosylase MltG [Brochothrix thermosphacta]|uniref:Endolytic murein transglycosylase n=1 Tax=Brochothrix thermosphacta TaxID=2756 RepID=A0A2X0S1N0_BROTH|nr:endolytic transglycosylase MltG [Brochothrix thermosphacta]SOC32370.1 conserved membrane associated protein [Brochothrix thermosphacta]SPP26692.1 putative membrane associated protein [Brochothrix thermosphacta]